MRNFLFGALTGVCVVFVWFIAFSQDDGSVYWGLRNLM